MMVVERIATWIPVTQESLDDAPFIRSMLVEAMRLAELADRGFLGKVRCARCRNRLRCVWAEVNGRHYGRDCYVATFGPNASPWPLD